MQARLYSRFVLCRDLWMHVCSRMTSPDPLQFVIMHPEVAALRNKKWLGTCKLLGRPMSCG